MVHLNAPGRATASPIEEDGTSARNGRVAARFLGAGDASGSSICKIIKGLTSKLGHTGVGMTQQGYEHPNPAQFCGIKPNHGNGDGPGTVHNYLFGSGRRNSSA